MHTKKLTERCSTTLHRDLNSGCEKLHDQTPNWVSDAPEYVKKAFVFQCQNKHATKKGDLRKRNWKSELKPIEKKPITLP